ncbi:MAG: hypothetical protein HC892_00220 [Saprospiraceae bacterium]|nr:hypothetical protein [Saprospiraceae bacterium]
MAQFYQLKIEPLFGRRSYDPHRRLDAPAAQNTPHDLAFDKFDDIVPVRYIQGLDYRYYLRYYEMIMR